MSPFACPQAGLYVPPAPCHLFKSYSVIPHVSPHASPPVTFVHSSYLCFLNTLGQRCHKELTGCCFGAQWVVVMLMASSHSAHPLQLQFPRACRLVPHCFLLGFFFSSAREICIWISAYHLLSSSAPLVQTKEVILLAVKVTAPQEAHVFVSLCGNICFPVFPLQWKVFKQIKYMRDRKFTFTFTYL